MITLDLVAYIQDQIKKNTPKDLITLRLIQSGWHTEDIDEGFLKAEFISGPTLPPVSTSTVIFDSTKPEEDEEKEKEEVPVAIKHSEWIDPYRELPDDETSNSSKVSTNVSKPKDEPKVWTPTITKPAIDQNKEVKTNVVFSNNINPVVQKVSPISPISPVVPKVVATPISVSPVISKPIIETPKIQPEPSVINPINFNGPVLTAASFNNQIKKNFSDFKPKTDSVNPSPYNPSSGQDLSAEKPIVQVPIVISQSSSSSPLSAPQSIPRTIMPQSQIVTTDNKFQSAILSSYKKDSIATGTIVKAGISQSTNKNVIKKLVIASAVVLFIVVLFFAVSNNYIKLPFSIIKNDPKIVLLNASTNFKSIKSYKADTEIKLSSPAIENITSGLLNREAVLSSDRDFILVSTKGLISKNNTLSPLTDNVTTISSSLLNRDIVADLKYDGSTSYVTVPNLAPFLGVNAPNASVVQVPKGKFDLIASELPSNVQDNLNKIGAFNILSNVMSSSFDSKLAPSLKEFINGSTMAEKDSGSIHGYDSYHYEVVVDDQVTKKFLSALESSFATNISPDIKSKIDEDLGSVKIDSFEVWIGKNDNNIHQYKFTLSIPLSKVLGLDDKGIADNKVSLDWQTSYYDFDVENNVVMPKDFIAMEDFVKNIRDMRIKDTLTSFGPTAKNLLNAEGSYGRRPNPTGSCTSPALGSIFSPLGHSQGASTVIGSIASSMNDLLDLADGSSSCYSTLGAWSIATPSVINPQTYYCVDNKGTYILESKPNSVACVAPVVQPKNTN